MRQTDMQGEGTFSAVDRTNIARAAINSGAFTTAFTGALTAACATKESGFSMPISAQSLGK
jgi:hypothetical protein